MAIEPGTRLGSYQVVSAIGAGGMGEVYRARDSQLKRDVAIKVLPPAFAQDPDRLARFRREAELLASMNHPHIAQIYGIEAGPAEAGHYGSASGRSRRQEGRRRAGVPTDASSSTSGSTRRSWRSRSRSAPGGPEPGTPVALFQPPVVSSLTTRPQYDVAKDGRFLVNVIVDDALSRPVTMLLNWMPRKASTP